jgi:hypothetical protein
MELKHDQNWTHYSVCLTGVAQFQNTTTNPLEICKRFYRGDRFAKGAFIF